MKDEIKEILDDLLFTTTLPNVSVKLSDEKLNQLKDYITDLQEENERLKENKLTPDELVNILNQELVRQNKDYKSTIDKALEYVNSTNFIYDVQYKKKDILENILNVYDKPIEEKKIPEKLPKSVTDNACSSKDMRLIANTLNQVIDYLKSKGEEI